MDMGVWGGVGWVLCCWQYSLQWLHFDEIKLVDGVVVGERDWDVTVDGVESCCNSRSCILQRRCRVLMLQSCDPTCGCGNGSSFTSAWLADWSVRVPSGLVWCFFILANISCCSSMDNGGAGRFLEIDTSDWICEHPGRMFSYNTYTKYIHTYI